MGKWVIVEIVNRLFLMVLKMNNFSGCLNGLFFRMLKCVIFEDA